MIKYLTYFEHVNGLSIFSVIKYFNDSNIEDFFKLNTYIGHISIAKIDESFDITNISDEAVVLFNIKINDINTLREYLREISDYGIMEHTLPKDRFTEYGPWQFNELTDHIYYDNKPYDNWIWNSDLGNWNPPIKYPELGDRFNISWNYIKSRWNIDLLKFPDRKYRSFQIWKSIPKVEDSFFGMACTSSDYELKPFEELTNGTCNFANIANSDHGIDYLKEKNNSDNPRRAAFKIVYDHELVLDLCPLIVVTYSIFEKKYIDQYSQQSIFINHPQCTAPTIQELFRLIIEWAWSHRQLNNNEPLAVHCDHVLRVLQMPIEVRNELLDLIPDQPVAKYIKGEINALNMIEEDPICPPMFEEWIMELYTKYPRRINLNTTHIDLSNLPQEYPI